MQSKEIATLILAFTLPLLIKFLFLAIISITNPSPENIEKSAELIAESAIIEWLASLPVIIVAVLIIVFINFLKWIGVIKQPQLKLLRCSVRSA